MSEEELNEKIKELKYLIKKDENEKSFLLLQLIIVSIGIMATGILLGSIFGQMALCVLTAMFACVPIDATKAMQFEKLKDNINRYLDQIKHYNNDIKKIRENQKTMGEVKGKVKGKEKEATTEKKKYEFKNEDKTKKDKKEKDIPIEFFDESDFLDNPDENKPKTR